MSPVVTTAAELSSAIEDGIVEIVVEGTSSGSPSITLPEGATLRGEGDGATLATGARSPSGSPRPR